MKVFVALFALAAVAVAEPDAQYYGYPYAGIDHVSRGLVAYPNGAVTPEDTFSVQAAKAQHFAAKANVYATHYPYAHYIGKREAEAEPKADAHFAYGYAGYPYAGAYSAGLYGAGVYGAYPYAGYRVLGKREAEAEPKADAHFAYGYAGYPYAGAYSAGLYGAGVYGAGVYGAYPYAGYRVLGKREAEAEPKADAHFAYGYAGYPYAAGVYGAGVYGARVYGAAPYAGVYGYPYYG